MSTHGADLVADRALTGSSLLLEAYRQSGEPGLRAAVEKLDRAGNATATARAVAGLFWYQESELTELALHFLGRMGTAGRAELAWILNALRKRSGTTLSLGEIPRWVLEAACDPNHSLHSAAFEALQDGLSPLDESYVPRLSVQLRHPELETRLRVLELLGSKGSDESRLSILVGALQHPDREARTRALELLREMGDKASPAFAKVAALAMRPSPKEEDKWLRSDAVQILADIAACPQKALEILIALLNDSEVLVREAAELEVADLGEKAAPAVPALLETLAVEEQNAPKLINDYWDPAEAEVILRHRRPSWVFTIGEAARPALIKGLSHPRKMVRGHAANALRLMGKKDSSASAILLQMLKDPEVVVRYQAIDALPVVAPDAKVYVAEFVRLLADPNERVRELVIRCLRREDVRPYVPAGEATALEELRGKKEKQP